MKEIIERFCGYNGEDANYKNGLLLIDLPTGIGKTHAVFDYIVENFERVNEHKGKFFFVTTLKKNLQIEKLQEKFELKFGDNGAAKFKRNVIFIDSNWETLYKNFSANENKIREHIKNKDLIDKIKYSIDTIKDYEDNSKKDKPNAEIDSDTDIAYESFAYTAKDELRSDLEPYFRKELEKLVNIKEDGTIRTLSEKKRLVKGELSFISELYPAVFTDDYKVILLSLDKFLSRNCPIIQNSYQFFQHKMMENSVVFFDEFDACKDTILNNIIEQTLKSKLNLIQMFRLIYDGLHNTEFTERLYQESEMTKERKKERKEKWRTPKELVSNLITIADEIYKTYSLQYFFKRESSQKEFNFIFHDIKYHNILSDGAAEVEIRPNKDKTINEIVFLKYDKNKDHSEKVKIKEGENYPLNSLLNRLRNFITYFQTGVNFLANNYLETKREGDSIVDYSKEWAIKTVLSECHIEGSYHKYLIDNIMINSRQRFVSEQNKSNDCDLSVYERGFRYYDFIDSEEHDTQTKMNYVAYFDSPEKFILNLATVAKVVGISATATLPTVTGNFDIEYFKRKLLSSFITVSAQEQARLNALFESKTEGYDKTNIIITAIDGGNAREKTQEEDIDKLKSIFDGNFEEASYLYGKITEKTDDNFEIKRYIRVFLAMNAFLRESKIKSILVLMNKKTGNQSSFQYSFLSDTFNYIRSYLQKSNCFMSTLWGNPNKFDVKKKKIHQRLAEGQKLFVFSTYQTLGAGQNLQYEVSDEILENLVQINETEYEDKFKDFDSIYLDKPTNVFVNLKNNDSNSDLAKYLYYVAFMRQNGELSLDESHDYISRAFRSSKFISIPEKDSIYVHYTRFILQAIGRICRTKNKNDQIHIYFDEELREILSKSFHIFENRNMNPEFKKLLDYCQKLGDGMNEDTRLKQQAENASTAMHRYIMGMLTGSWSFSSQKRWRELREAALKYPCVNELNSEMPVSMYIKLPNPEKGYYFKEENDYTDTVISFKTELPGKKFVSEKTCGLVDIMKYEPLKKHFILMQYATAFEYSKYFIPPVVFNNIYKGALGEAAGRYIIENSVLRPDNHLDEIEELSKFEKFDFVFNNDIYIDFKHYSTDFFINAEAKLSEVLTDLEACRGKKAIIVNILSLDDEKEYFSRTLANKKVLVVPYLLNRNGNLNQAAVKTIREFLYE